MLQQCVRAACNSSDGWIRFSDFMNIALYEPGLGYYSGGLQKFGQQGDFITSPEVSPLFGQCLASQLSEVLKNLKKINNEKVFVIEFGAGSGALAVDILLQLEKLGSLPERYFILELSAELRQRQKEALKDKAAHLLGFVQWLDNLPEGMTNAVVVANEVLDAMPVECFKVVDNQIETLVVGLDNGDLVSRYITADDEVVEKVSAIQQRSNIEYSNNYCSEYNPAISGWLSALECEIKNLVILLIDYGYNEKEYYHPDRVDGTLMCYYQHRAHDNFLWWPGLQDITAFVNFTDVAYSAVDLGMEISGYTTQAAFLLANGLSELHAEQVTDDVQEQVKLSQQIKTLTLPSEMGDRFKVMALTKNYDEPITGFSMLDLRNRL
ncbi:MAG: SAM-dependent methyltransferase [Gammaproteobacteria bacterium]|nr:SAM-dependent methyltransferase [Gammaproteobacteria bacterium]